MQSFLSPRNEFYTGSNYSLQVLQMKPLGDILTKVNGLLNPLSGQTYTYVPHIATSAPMLLFFIDLAT